MCTKRHYKNKLQKTFSAQKCESIVSASNFLQPTESHPAVPLIQNDIQQYLIDRIIGVKRMKEIGWHAGRAVGHKAAKRNFDY